MEKENDIQVGTKTSTQIVADAKKVGRRARTRFVRLQKRMSKKSN